MLKITQRQMDQLAAPTMQKLERTCLEHLKKTDPKRFDVPDTTTLRVDIRRHIKDSRHLAFQFDASILEYVRICLRRRTDYPTLMERADVRAIFDDPDLPETEKLYLAENLLSKP